MISNKISAMKSVYAGALLIISHFAFIDAYCPSLPVSSGSKMLVIDSSKVKFLDRAAIFNTNRNSWFRPCHKAGISAQANSDSAWHLGNDASIPSSGYPEGISYSPLTSPPSAYDSRRTSFRKFFVPNQREPSALELRGKTRLFLDTADAKYYRLNSKHQLVLPFTHPVFIPSAANLFLRPSYSD